MPTLWAMKRVERLYDGDTLVASLGKLHASGPRFQFSDFTLASAVVDIDEIRTARSRSASFPVEVSRVLAKVVPSDFDFGQPSGRADLLASSGSDVAPATWELTDNLKEEEFTRSVSLGLFDYLRKSRAHGFVVSLSGGADSSAVSLLCGTMVQLAVQNIGVSGVHAKLSHMQGIDQLHDARALIGRLLTCVYQQTRNSSDTTLNAARDVASGLGATFYVLDVDHLVQGYIDLVSAAVDRELTWSEDDLALQNIQARARGPSVWMLANLSGALLLATSNRSEAAVGYATMDGDTCGGLSPIAGIDKAFLRHWLRWMERQGPAGLGPCPFLASVNEQEPTAELRPAESKQTDESDLMPYDVLEAIERAAIRDKLVPRECLDRLASEFPGQEQSQLQQWVIRFFQLWCRNQWKRERYAPCFHLDDKNLDPKTWCRFPILSGGYARELRELP